MLDRIKAVLQSAGIAVYDPGVKIGECKQSYAVARSLGVETLPGSKGLLGRRTYEVLLVVPLARQSELAAMAESVKAAMASLPLRLSSVTDQDLEQAYRAAGCSLIYTQNLRL